MNFGSRKYARCSTLFLLVGTLIIISLDQVGAQSTMVTLIDSTKVKTDIINISDRSLFTGAGSFNLTEVYSVRFFTEDEFKKKYASATKLLDFGVIVYVLDRQQQPSDSAKVAVNRKIIDNQGSPTNNYTGNNETRTPTSVSAGIGLGQDYGGIGGRLTLIPEKHIGLFFGGGYALAGFGYNAGALLMANPDKRLSPTLSFMYGYNAAVAIVGASQFNKIFYGPTLGFGLKIVPQANEKNYVHIELLVPFRPAEFDTYFDALKSNPAITGLTRPWPVTISFGYHFIIN